MPGVSGSPGGTAEGHVNGGGGLGGTDLSARAGAPAGPWSIALTEVDAVGDVLTLLQPDPGPEPVPDPLPSTLAEPGSTGPLGRRAAESNHGAARESARDLVQLARRFARADEQQAHDLFAAVFGLYGARHFGIAPAPDAADLGRVSWWHGPTVHRPVDLACLLPVQARRARRRPAAPAADLPGADRLNPGRHRKPELRLAALASLAAERPGAAEEPPDPALGVERRVAARMLLAHPLVTATGPHAEAFALIRRHADWLAERFERLLGYPLVVTAGFARLHKAGIGPGALRRLDLDGVPCRPETYAALALALSVLPTGPDSRPAGQLAEVIAVAAGAAGIGPVVGPAGIGPAAVSAALALLTRWQVLTPTGQGPDGVLAVDRELAAVLGAVPAEPVGAAAGEPAVDVPVAVRRRLAETPVVLLCELTALEREWLWESRRCEAETFAEFLGLTAEIRSEGVALLDPAGELTDLRLPSAAAPAHAALLLVEHLVDQLRPLPDPAADGAGVPAVTGVPIPEALIDGTLGDVADEYGAAAGWGRDHLADRAAFRREVLDLLHRMRLIAPLEQRVHGDGSEEAAGPRGRSAGGWMLLAPAARYAAQAELRPVPGTGRHSRREELS
ncbi:hypothetical protein P3T37_002989 [Kitasatospora sp. MAA4]|uniref:DUF2398 family protein n=1 Tax=Kitasatospora sp. MAA4 TaxID=3035093 RepID=UPI002474C858|nr:DUF2398 family protein [Kitasatospora sp. MAA4]MDH6133593.1 hypothetical protein [Kitasatospora sp. MAA4]